MQNFKGAIFDMDGTLLDSMPVWKRLTQRYLAQFDVHITDADYAVCEGFSQPQVAEYFLKRYPNLPLTQQQMLDGMDEMITSRYETIARPKDGVIDFLEGLRARGIKMAIATLTARRHAEKALIDRDMMKYFEFMLTIEDVGVPKYEPDIYLEAAKRLGIRVSHAGYSPYAVSNYTVMLMLMCIRKAGYIMFRSHTADYSLGASGAARGMEMQNLTVGVIGTGRIGKAVIHNLSGFGCRIIAHDPFPSEEMKQMGVEYVSLESLYAQSDVITLHTFLNDSTYHMINTEAIQQMKPGVVIINCARGALIDTRALIDGIESGRVGSVGVDCFEGEDDVIRVDHNYNSRVTNHDYIILKSFQNTIVTPHVAFFTDQAVFDMVQCSLESLHQFELGEKVPLEVHAA